MIEVQNLVKKYGDHLAVDHLNFTIDKGKIYGFLGPNGAGKSTTMNIMTGYIGPSEGDVLINGHSIVNEPDEDKKFIGYLPELPPLYTEMKVIEYLNFAAAEMIFTNVSAILRKMQSLPFQILTKQTPLTY